MRRSIAGPQLTISGSDPYPLRANLPTRGLRYSFIQALQTETDRPLTIRLHARNEARTGWFTRFIQCGLGFVVLWIGAASALRLRPTRS